MSQNKIDKLVFDTSYKYLDSPVILTSGQDMTPVFFNGENVIGDNAQDYKKYKMNPVGMYSWAVDQLNESMDFFNFMNFVKNNVDLDGIEFISGGRTRDWPFSAALAYLTKKDALFFYKPLDGSNPLLIRKDGAIISPKSQSLKGARGIHVVDLVTTASSVVNPGFWLDQAEDLSVVIDMVYAGIDRNQGAEDNIAARGVKLRSAVKVTAEKLSKFDAEHVDEVVSYLNNPHEWTMNHLEQYGVSAFESYLTPGTFHASKDNRFLKFMLLNEEALDECGLLEQILSKVDTFRAVEDKEKGVIEGELYFSAIEKYKV